MHTLVLLLCNLGVLVLSALFLRECFRENEQRATKVAAAILIFFVLLIPVILWSPSLRFIPDIVVGLLVCLALSLLIPARANREALAGTAGHLRGEVKRFDERDAVFARVRLSPDKEPYYRNYYAERPDQEEADAQRRAKGLLGKLGSIDNSYQPLKAMIHAAFDIPDILGRSAKSSPVEGEERKRMDPVQATELVKQFGLHIGADMVGICKVNPLWVYSHRGEIHYGNYNEWGEPLDDFPAYAVVLLTEMNWDHVSAAPHSPSVAESANDYAKGAYLSTVMGRWFAHMGYRGIAQNTRNYDTVLVPLAVDAGLGEVGRQGYLIAPRFGARVRVFATLTDMELVPDKPVSLGIDEFCQRCKKCSDTCPSRSIPAGEKTITNGIRRWKLDEDSCFEYWSKVGTDCSICMAVCPFSRPDTLSHKLVRTMLERSLVARRWFPAVDNLIYGKRWRPKQVPTWLKYPKAKESRKETY